MVWSFSVCGTLKCEIVEVVGLAHWQIWNG